MCRARRTPHPIIKHLIKSPCSWKWLWEMAVNLETKRPASGRWRRGSEGDPGRNGQVEGAWKTWAARAAGLTPVSLQLWGGAGDPGSRSWGGVSRPVLGGGVEGPPERGKTGNARARALVALGNQMRSRAWDLKCSCLCPEKNSRGQSRLNLPRPPLPSTAF